MDLIRKKIYVSTGIKMLIAIMFIGFGMAAGILTGAIQNFGGYIKGYNAEYITSLKDFENITMYNTQIIEVENITPTNIKYYDGFTNEMLYRIDNLPKNVMLIGATNNLETIDKAIIRKGRLGNQYEVKNNFKKEEVIEFIKDYFNSSKMSNLNKYATFISTMIYYMNGSEISNILNKIKGGHL
jgi:SpoVK/Ycf46/Vps4 family AAA+-type ATPase